MTGCGADMCFEPEGAVESVNWVYAGQGKGGYDRLEEISFVGKGKGSYSFANEAEKGGRFGRTCWIALTVLLLCVVLAAGSFLISTSNVPTVVAKSWAQVEAGAVIAGGAAASVFRIRGGGSSSSSNTSHASEAKEDLTLATCQRQKELSISDAASCCHRFGLHCYENPPKTERATTTTAAPLSFDCTADIDQWELSWSDMKKGWCCQHVGQGCGSTVGRGSADVRLPQVTRSYNCNENFASWVTAWSEQKKAWCCEHENRACSWGTIDAERDSPLYNCDLGYSSGVWLHTWTDSKKSWCCEHRRQGCPDDAEALLRLQVPQADG